MARKSQQDLKAEQAEETQLASAAEAAGVTGVSRVDTSMPFVPLAPPQPDGTRPSSLTPEQEKASKPQCYRVMRDTKILQGNCLTMLRKDKVIDDRHYNLDQLRSQGAELELVKE